MGRSVAPPEGKVCKAVAKKKMKRGVQVYRGRRRQGIFVPGGNDGDGQTNKKGEAMDFTALRSDARALTAKHRQREEGRREICSGAGREHHSNHRKGGRMWPWGFLKGVHALGACTPHR